VGTNPAEVYGCSSFVFFVCSIGSIRCDELITISEESYPMCVSAFDLETSTMWRPRPELFCRAA